MSPGVLVCFETVRCQEREVCLFERHCDVILVLNGGLVALYDYAIR